MISQEQIFGVDATHLIQVGESQHFLTQRCADAFLTMQADAFSLGIDLQIVSSFRDFKRQLSIWNRKWRGELPMHSLSGDKLNPHKMSADDKIHAILLWSALPGASRHHWGTDLDVFDKQSVMQSSEKFQLVPQEYRPGGPCAKLSEWLDQHANRYGFEFPYQTYRGGVAEEPWHLSYSPEASEIISHYTLESLATLLAQTDIEGKDDILNLLPTLFERYTLNKGTKH